MAPRKSATKATSDDSAPEELILTYLKAQNRPYSATDISANLHNKVTKTKADKLLKDLFERNEIGGKASGKQWVFWCLQHATDTATPEELTALDESISTLRERIPDLKALHKSKTASLSVLRSAPTTEALRVSVDELQRQKSEFEARLKLLRSGSVSPISAAEKQKTREELVYWGKKEAARRRIWKEAEGMVLEGMGREELYDKLGIDY